MIGRRGVGWMALASWALAAGGWGCGETAECKQLKVMLEQRKGVLAQARMQSSVAEKLEARAKAAEASTNKLLGELGWSDPESKLFAVLDERVKRMPGATLERTTAPSESDSPEPDAIRESQTMWVVRFKEKELNKAIAFLDTLIASPPLLKLATFAKVEKKDDWRIEFLRLSPDQIPIKPEVTKLEPPKDLSTIPSQIGTCGAGRMRDETRKIDSQIAELTPAAERTTTLLPTVASFEGLQRRAEVLRDTELESRRHVKTFLETAQKLKLPFKAVGTEGVIVALEVWGSSKDRGRLEKDLVARGAGGELKVAEASPAGIVRVMLPNTVAEQRRARRHARGMMPGAPDQPGQERPRPKETP